MTTQFHHINLCAKDPSDLENFYKDVLELSESNAYTGNQKQIKNQGYGGRVAFLTDGTKRNALVHPRSECGVSHQAADQPS